MKEVITSYVGLDIHKDTVAIAVAEAGRTAPRFIGTINPFPAELCKALRRQHCTPGNSLLVYEAGPCGYGWARYLRKQGWKCEVIAPSRITRQAAEKRLKTDRRDAMLLARELARVTSHRSLFRMHAMKPCAICAGRARMLWRLV